MSDRAITIVEEAPSRDEYEQRSGNLERNLDLTRKNIEDIRKTIIEVEKEIDILWGTKENLDKKNKKLKLVIKKSKREAASHKALKSGRRRLESGKTKSSDSGELLNKLEDEREELIMNKMAWEDWKEDLEKERRRRMEYEAWMREEERRNYEDWKKSIYRPVR
ncbi:hypothetical protein BFJ69_g4852 [Fusarium oxysporum]|uniref:Uncharacterized protein n=1 Tax=Fusarium oxysporum TaxID=5507 RepID=A0A420NGK3_FUSOX|nr:hypothetical protein BFJ69_g4852 [Fusarium oxysporum]